MESGIYAISSPSGKQYVGSALDFNRRWGRHLLLLRNGTHPNFKLLKAFSRYGENGLVFSKLLICEPTMLLEYEQALIDHLRPKYNIALFAGAPMRGRKASHETRAVLSARKSGAGNYQFGRTGELSTWLGRTHSETTRLLLSERQRGALNHMFGKNQTPESNQKRSVALKGQPKSESWRAKRLGENNSRAHSVTCLDTGAKFSTINDAIAFLRLNGHPLATHSAIAEACAGKRKSAYKYRWQHSD